MDICIHSMYCLDLYMADENRGREASRLRDTAGKQHEKELQALQKWGTLEPFPGKAWKSCHAYGPEVEDEIFHDFPRSYY